MAKGLAAAIDRFATVIERCDVDTAWKRSKQRISGLKDPNAIDSGLDKKYWVVGKIRGQRAVVSGSLVTSNCRVFVEMARHWGKGDKNAKDHYGLHRDLESLADKVEQSLLHPNNWNTNSTGVILVNIERGEVEELEQPPVLLWTAEFNVTIRHPQVATVV